MYVGTLKAEWYFCLGSSVLIEKTGTQMYFLQGKVCENPFMELVCQHMLCKVSRRSLPFLLGDYIINMSWASIISRSFMYVSEHSVSKVLNSKLEYWLSDAWVTAFLRSWIRPQGPRVFLEISSSYKWEMWGLKQRAPQGGKTKGPLQHHSPPRWIGRY